MVADQEELEESFHLNVLDSDAGIQMADRILSSCAERLLQKRLFSAIILTGRGFAQTDWASDFMQQNPVIAVPTSVGYGASFHGLSALITMINSCANGISVVNIDNGYGAAYLAAQINRLAVREPKKTAE